MLGCLEAAEADMASAHERWGGALRIGVLPTIGNCLLPEATQRLHSAFPRTELQVEQMEAEESLPALKRGELDVALASEYGSVPQHMDPGLARYDFLVENMLVALPSDHATRESVARLTALSTQRWIAPAQGSSCLTMLERACGLAGFEPHITGHCGEFTLAMKLVEAGLGVTLVPATIAYQSRGESAIQLLSTEPRVPRTLYLAARRGGSQRPAVQRFLQALSETAQQWTQYLPGNTAIPGESAVTPSHETQHPCL